MSSTMQAWRTDARLSQAEMYATINSFFQSSALSDYWADVDDNTTGQVDYYISGNIFLRVIHSGTSYAIIPYCGTTAGNNIVFYTYSNLSIYKVNNCMAICVNSSNQINTLTAYSKTANIIMDSTNSGTGKALFYAIGAAGYSTMFDSTSSASMNLYTPYVATYSLKTDTNLAQIVPLKNNLLDKSFDNLHGVLLTPVMNGFVSLQNEKWLFTNGMALPAGSEVPAPVYIDTVTPSSS